MPWPTRFWALAGSLLMRSFAAAGGVGLEALLLQPGAQGDVLGVAQLRRSHLLALQVLGALDARLHHEERAARRRARDDPDRLTARLCVGVDGRVGADVRGVERTRGHGLDRGRAGVERARLELHVASELVLEDAALYADDRRRMGYVGEVAEPERDVALLRRRPRAGRREKADRDGGDDREHRQPGQPAGDVHRGGPPMGGWTKNLHKSDRQGKVSTEASQMRISAKADYAVRAAAELAAASSPVRRPVKGEQ